MALCPRSGIIGERLPIRLYLTAGMLASGLLTCLFGLGYVYNIHSLSFYITVQVGLAAASTETAVLISAPLPASRWSTVWSKPPAGPVSSPASATGLGKDGTGSALGVWLVAALASVLQAGAGSLKAVMSLPVRRGLIMGLWNSHTSVGNILGSLIAGYWVSSNWGLSFIVPGAIIAGMGVACFLFLIERECARERRGRGQRAG